LLTSIVDDTRDEAVWIDICWRGWQNMRVTATEIADGRLQTEYLLESYKRRHRPKFDLIDIVHRHVDKQMSRLGLTVFGICVSCRESWRRASCRGSFMMKCRWTRQDKARHGTATKHKWSYVGLSEPIPSYIEGGCRRLGAAVIWQ
jgi:hypothetical protein